MLGDELSDGVVEVGAVLEMSTSCLLTQGLQELGTDMILLGASEKVLKNVHAHGLETSTTLG